MTQPAMVWIVILGFITVILVALGTSLFYIIQGKREPKKTARSLTLRIVCSLSLFVLLFISFAMGWIRPHGIKPTRLEPIDQYKQE